MVHNYHFTKINNDTNGNPQYKFNVYFQSPWDGRTLRVLSPKLGKFSKKHDAYIIKYYGDDKQTNALISQIVTGAGFELQEVK